MLVDAEHRGQDAAPKVGWRVREFSRAVGLSRAYIWEQIAVGRLKTVKAGSARIILTQPSQFLAALKAESKK